MEQQGLHFVKFYKNYTVFEEGEPLYASYYIHLCSRNENKQELINKYKDRGLEYVSSTKYTHIFRSRTKIDTLELHTNAKDETTVFDNLYTEYMKSIIFVGMAVLGTYGVYHAVHKQAYDNMSTVYMAAMIILCMMVSGIGRFLRARRIIKDIKLDTQINTKIIYQTNWERQRKNAKLFYLVVEGWIYILIILSICLKFVQGSKIS